MEEIGIAMKYPGVLPWVHVKYDCHTPFPPRGVAKIVKQTLH